MGNLQLNGRTIAIGALILIVVVLIGSQLLGGGNRNPDPTTAPTLAPNVGGDTQTGGVALGNVVVSSGIDGDGCPVDSTTTFSGTDAIYVVVEDSDIPAGTDVFARLFREGSPVEDADIITADRDYTNTCIYFVFEATQAAQARESGNYEAQIIVNGNPGDRVSFQVQ